MPSIWEVILAGPADTAIPLTAPHAVISGWLDDPISRPGASTAVGQQSEHGPPHPGRQGAACWDAVGIHGQASATGERLYWAVL